MSRRLSHLVRVLALIALATLGSSTYAQTIDTNMYAVLAEGPEQGHGIDGIYPNVIPFWHSIYLVAGQRIELFLVQGPIAGAERWEPTDCRLQSMRSPAPNFYYYNDMGGWSVLFHVVGGAAVPAGEEGHSSLVCDFASRLIDRFLYFKRSAPVVGSARESVPAMPAIVELN